MILEKGSFPCNTPCSLVMQVMKSRLHFGNSKIQVCDDGWILKKTSDMIQQQADLDVLPIPPTQRESNMMRVTITSGTWTINGWKDSEMCFSTILDGFGQEHQVGTQVRLTSDKMTIVLPKPFIVPITKINWHETKTGAILILCKNTFLVVWRRNAQTVEELLRLIPQVTDIQTEGSCISNVIGCGMLLHEKPPPICMLIPTGIDMGFRWIHSLPVFRSQSGCVTAEMPKDVYQDFVCALKAVGIDYMCTIWGWTICMSNVDQRASKAEIHFRRVNSAVVLTTDNFQDLLAMWVMRLLLPADRCIDASGVPICIRFHNSKVWQGIVKSSWTIHDVNEPWTLTMIAFQKDCPIRSVIHGKWRPHDDHIQVFLTEPFVRIQWILPTYGGGKDDTKYVAKNKFASILLMHGISFTDVADYVEMVSKNVSPGKLLHELSNIDKPSGWIKFKEWLEKMGHPVPHTDKHLEKAVQKIQKAVRKRRDIGKQQVLASQINILPDHFLKEDRTPAVILKTMIDAKTGVILMDPQDATVWINDSKPISSEPLACIVIGHSCPADDVSQCHPITVPTVDSTGQPLLVAGCMHQLGSKPIIIPQDDMVNMTTDQSIIMSFTVYKDECDRDLWNAITDNPVKTILHVIKKEFDQNFLACGPWGRSWRNDKKPCGNDIATSFQFHARVKLEHFKSIMSISGRGPIYTTPKSEDKGLLPGWAIVWMHSSKQDAIISMSKMPEQHAGLVRTGKGIGIRVKQDIFEQSFKFLRPKETPPPSVAAKFLFKLQPLPPGMTAENVQQFTKSKGWVTRPMKALGGSAWLVASETVAPQQWMGLNGTLVLVKAVEQAQQRDKPIVLAGKLESKYHQKNIENAKGADPWVSGADPWQQYQPMTSHASVKPVPTGLHSHSLADPSLAKRLQEQDDQIQTLQTSIKEIQKNQKQSVIDAKNHQQHVDGKLKSLQTEMGDQMSNLSSQFQASLQTALANQDKQINAGFAELKSLFTQSRGCNEQSSASKRQKGPIGKGGGVQAGQDVPLNSDTEMGTSPLKSS